MKRGILYLFLLVTSGTLVLPIPALCNADGKLDSVEWNFEQDYEPLDVRSEFDTISVKVKVSNTSPSTESFRILFELIENVSSGLVKDWMYGGPTHIGGWASQGDMAEHGFLDIWGEVQNTLPIPPYESQTYNTIYTFRGPPPNSDLEIRITLYDIEGTPLDRFDSTKKTNLRFTLLPFEGTGEPPQDAQGWLNTNKPTYTDSDTIIIEYAMPTSTLGKDRYPTYQSSWDNAMVNIYDITAEDILVDSYPLQKAKGRIQDYQEWGETGGKAYSISKFKDSFPITNYLTLNPDKIGRGLIEGHSYEVALKNDSGQASYLLPFDVLDVFTYLGAGEPHINLETSIEKIPSTPNNLLPIYNYNIAYTNIGFADAYEVIIAENIPTESTYLKGSASYNSAGTKSISPNIVQFFDGITWSNAEPSDPSKVISIRWLWDPNVIAANDNRDDYGPDEGMVGFEVTPKPGMVLSTKSLGTASVTYRSKDEPPRGIAQMSISSSPQEQKQGVITFDRILAGDKVGQHKAPPTTQVEMTVTIETSEELRDAVLTDYFPKGWTVTDSKGGIISEYSIDYNQIVWQLGTVTGKVTKSYIIKSPQLIIPPVKYYFQTELTYSGGLSKSETWMVIVSDPAANLTISKSDNPDPVQPGSNITYTITYGNSGDQKANNVKIKDTIPTNTTFVSVTGGGTESGGVVTWNIGTLNAGVTGQTVQLVVKAISGLTGGTIITNATYSIEGSGINPVLGSAVETTVMAPNLTISKTDSPDPVLSGSNITYTITYGNSGNGDATGVVITDNVPTNTTFVSASGGGTESGGVVTWNIGTLNAGVTGQTVQLVVKTNNGLTDGTIIANNTYSIDCNETTAVSGGTVQTTVSATPTPSLTISKTDTPDPVQTGSNITYTITYGNSGSANATGVVITDTVPTNTTFVSASGGGTESGGVVTWNIGTLNAGVTVQTVQLVVKTNNGLTDGTIIANNTYSIDCNETTAVSGSTVQTTIKAPNLTITKTDSPDPVPSGNNITYTITYGNSGNGNATDVVITDNVPTNTTFVSATGGGTESGSVVTWNIGTLNAGVTGQTVQLVVKTNNGLTDGTIIANNTYSIDCNETTAVSGGTVQTTVTTKPVLTISKSDSPDPVQANGNITYTITYGNSGSANATGVVITDKIPTNTTFESATNGGTYSNSTKKVTWNIGNLNAGVTGQTVELKVKTKSNLSNGDIITNIGTDYSIDCNETVAVTGSDVQTTIGTAPNLTISKSDSPDPVKAGNNITYTITYGNSGNASATNTAITDTLPTNTSFVSAGSGTESGGVVTWNIGTLNAGVTNQTVQLVVKTNNGLTDGTTISNSTYSIDCTETVPVTGVAVSTQIGTAPNLTVSKTDSPDPVESGKDITYTITYGNTGTKTATSTILKDTIPANTTFKSATGGGALSGNEVIWNLGLLNEGVTNQTVQFVVTVNEGVADGTIINNSTYSIDCAETDPVNGTAQGTTVTAPGRGKVIATDEILVGGTIYVRITDSSFKGDGDSPAIEVELNKNSGAEKEKATLTETGGDAGIFVGSIPTSNIGKYQGNYDGTFRVASGDTIVTTYKDASPVGDRTALTKVVSSKQGSTGSVSVLDNTYTSSVSTLKPGTTVYIQVDDSDLNLNSGANNDLTFVTVTTTKGDSETLFIPEDQLTEGRFRITLTTSEKSPPTTNNGNLELTGGDKITVTYVDSLDANDLVNQSRTATVLVITGTGIANIVEIAISPGDTLNLEVLDADLSGSVGVSLTTTNGDSETVTLNETATKGVFRGTFSTVKDTAKTGNGTLEVQEGDTITLTYSDASPKADRTDTCIVITITGTGAAKLLEKPVFPGDTITGLVADSDLNITSGGSNDTVSVRFVTNDANNPSLDDETLILSETTTPGLFTGTIATTESFSVFPSNGTLEVIPDDTITLEYTDAKDLEGKKNQSRTDSITVSKKPAEVTPTLTTAATQTVSTTPTGISPTQTISGTPTTTQQTTSEQSVASPTTVAATRTETQTTTQQTQTAQTAQTTGTQTTTQTTETTYTPPQAEIPPPVSQTAQAQQAQTQTVTRAPGIAGTQPPSSTTKVPEAPPQYEAPEVPESQRAAEEEKEEVSSQAKPEEKPPVEEVKKAGESPVIERLPELTIFNLEAVVSGMLPKDMPSAIITKPEFTTDAAMYCSSEFFLTGITKLISSYESRDLTILVQKAYEYSLANIKWSSKDSSVQKPEKITSPGSLGSSLIAQALAGREYTGKSDWEGLLGLSLGLEMSDKVQFISDRLFFDGKSIGSLKDKPAGYVPHRVKVIEKGGKLNIEVPDKSSHLVDYAYLIWGMSEYLKAFKNIHPKGDVSGTRDRLIDLNLALYNNIKARHYDSNTETFIDTNDGKKGTRVSLSNAALSIVGLASFYESITDPAIARSVELKMKGISKDVKSIVIKEADFIVHKLQADTGEFHDGHLEGRALKKEGASISKDGLLIQASGIRGLLAAWRLTGDKKYLEGAKNGFDYMDKNFRDKNLLIYRSSLTAIDYIYTPINVGMTVGALREMSNMEGYKDLALSRLSGFFDRIVEGTGLINIATGKNIIKDTDKERILKVAGKHPAIIPLLNSEVKIKLPVPESDKPETLIYDLAKSNVTDKSFPLDSGMLCSAEFYLTGMMKPSPRYEWTDMPILTGKAKSYAIENIKGLPKISDGFNKPFSSGSLGAGLLGQVLMSGIFRDKTGIEKAQGLELGMEMSKKIALLHDKLFFDGSSLGSLKDMPNSYIPHLITGVEKNGKLNFEASDKTSILTDYAYLAWGLGEYLKICPPNIKAQVLNVGKALFSSIKDRHYDGDMGTLIDVHYGKKSSRISMSNAALSIVGLASLYETMTDPEVKTMIIKEADFIVHKLQEPAGEFSDGYWITHLLRKEGAETSKDGLLIQVSGIRGLLVAWNLTGDKKYLEGAKKGFDYMDKNFWDENLLIYRSSLTTGDYIYTPVNVGMTVGALREMSNIEGYTDLALSRLSRFFDRIVEDAGLVDTARSLSSLNSRIELEYPLNKGTGKLSAGIGDTILYKISVQNTGIEPARGIALKVTLPEGVHLAETTGIQGGPVWQITELQPNKSFVLTFKADVKEVIEPGEKKVLIEITRAVPGGTPVTIKSTTQKLTLTP